MLTIIEGRSVEAQLREQEEEEEVRDAISSGYVKVDWMSCVSVSSLY
jgi:hypothetical protein